MILPRRRWCSLALGTLTVRLYEEFGVAGLAPLALVVLLPRAIVPRLSQAHDPAKLDRTAAISLFARAIAESLGLDAAQKRVLRRRRHPPRRHEAPDPHRGLRARDADGALLPRALGRPGRASPAS